MRVGGVRTLSFGSRRKADAALDRGGVIATPAVLAMLAMPAMLGRVVLGTVGGAGMGEVGAKVAG